MGIQNREGALYMATGFDNSGLYKGKHEAIGIIKAMAGEITSFDVFGGIGISAGIAFAKAAKDAYTFEKEFQKSMYEVATISGQIKGSLTDYMNSIMDMTRKIPVAANDSAKALYQIVSAGHDGADAMKVLEISAKAAIGGVTDTATAADAITTILNAYKMSANEAEKVSDQLFTTARLGKTTMGELGKSIAQAAPIAASFGINIEDILAAVASVTKQGVPTAEAMTKIRAAIMGASNHLGDAAFKGRTFQETLQAIYNEAQGSSTKMKELLGTDEALGAALMLTGKNAKNAASDLMELNHSAGATEAAFAKMKDSVVAQMQLLQNNITASLRPLGETVLKEVSSIAEAFNLAFKDGSVEESIKTLGELIVTVTGAFIGYKGAVALSTIVQQLNMAVTKQAVLERKLERAAIASGALATDAHTSAQLRNIAMQKMLTSAIKVQTAAFLKNTAAILTNPYILAAAAVAALGYGIYKYCTQLSAAEEAQKNFNKHIKDQKKQAEDEKKYLEEKIDILQNETSSRNQVAVAMIDIKKEYPELFKKYIDEKGHVKDLIGLWKEYNDVKELDAIVGSKAQVDKAKKELLKVGEEINYRKGSTSGRTKFFRNETTAELRDRRSGLLKTYLSFQSEYNKLKEVQDKVDKDINDARNKELEKTNAQKIKSYQDELKVAQSSYNKLLKPDSRSTESDRKSAKDKVEELKKKIEEIIGITDKQHTKSVETLEEISKTVLDVEIKLQQERVAIMADGRRKALAEIEIDKKSRLNAIDDEEKELSKKYKSVGKNIPKNISDNFTNRRKAVTEDASYKSKETNKDYDRQEIEFQKELSSVFLTEEEKRKQSIKDRYDEMRRLQKQAYDNEIRNIDLTKTGKEAWDESTKALMKFLGIINKIDGAQVAEESKDKKETYNSLVAQLDDFKSREYTLNTEWDKKIAEAKVTGDADLIERMKQGKEKAQSEFHANMLQQSDNWKKLFANLDTLTAEQISKLIKDIESQMASGNLKLNPVDYKALVDSLNQARDKVVELNPFKALGSYFTGYRKALDELEKAKKNGLSGEDLIPFEAAVKKSAQGVVKSIGEITSVTTEVGNSFASMFESFGNDKLADGLGTAVELMGELGKTAGGVGKIMAGDIVGGIKDIITGITSIFTIFNKAKDKKLQKDIEASEKAVKKLEWAFSDLERAMNKTLGEDKYKYTSKMIDNIRQQQQEIIRQQNDERKKKNSDQGTIDELGRKYIEYGQQIEDILEKVKNDFIGGTAQDIAQRLGDAFIEAFAKGEDAAKTWEKTVKEIIGDIVKRMLITKLFEVPIGGIIDQFWEMYNKDNESGSRPGGNRPGTIDGGNENREGSSRPGGDYDNNRNTTSGNVNNSNGSNSNGNSGGNGSSRPGGSNDNEDTGGNSRPGGRRAPELEKTNENILTRTGGTGSTRTNSSRPSGSGNSNTNNPPQGDSGSNSNKDTNPNNSGRPSGSGEGNTIDDIFDWLYDQLMGLGEGMGDKMKPFYDLLNKFLGGDEEIKDGVSGQLQASMTEGTGSQLVGLWNMTALDIRALKDLSAEHFNEFKLCRIDVNLILEQTRLIQANTLRTANNTDGLKPVMEAMKSELEDIKKNTKSYNGRG